VLDVVAGGLGRDHQILRHLLVRQTDGPAVAVLRLRVRSIPPVLAAAHDAMPAAASTCFDRVGLESTASHSRRAAAAATVGCARLSVRARLTHRLIRIRGPQDPRERRDRVADQAAWITRTIETSRGAARRSVRVERAQVIAGAFAR
jgi:hypothetical protein